MQRQAERLAAQGRYGDSMLVHMNPAEVQGIASLVPGGQLPTNPQTGQPEAFPWLLAAKIAATAAGALKGRSDAKKASKRAQKATAAIEARQKPFDKFSAEKIREAGGSSALGIGPSYEDVKDKSKISFLPEGMSSGINFDYQRTPGAIYANYRPPNPFERGPIQDEVVDEVEESVVTPPPDVPPDEWYPEKRLEDLPPYFDQYPIAQINADLETRGMPKLETLEDIEGYIQEAERRGRSGMPQLMLPFTMADGGIMSTLGNFGTSKPIEEMTREELIEYIKSSNTGSSDSSGGTLDVVGRKVPDGSSGGVGVPGSDIGALRDFISSASMSAANGGEIQYPRMGGQISGPGTERSDDIPAMLSDGEFVVNAKGLRGLGKINGASGGRADQRREGARTMYALQRAGEQAMRRT
tara:strand:- start:965 stop:2200 length:1236 start_codon:yes stop_codon:yes gene_type:complete